MAIQDYLERKIVQLEEEHARALQTLEDVRERMSRADASYREEIADPEKARKWTIIIRKLEDEHERVRRHGEACGIEIEEKKHKLKEYIENEEAREQQLAEMAMRINDMTVEELAMLSLEDITLLQEYELKHTAGVAVAAPMTAVASAPSPASSSPEPATPQRAAVAPERAVPPHSPQDGASHHAAIPLENLHAIVAKLSREHLKTLTLGEVETLLEFYASLGDGSGGDERQKRLRAIIEAGLIAVDGACVQFHARWSARAR